MTKQKIKRGTNEELNLLRELKEKFGIKYLASEDKFYKQFKISRQELLTQLKEAKGEEN